MTRQDKIATALCAMSAGLGIAKQHLPDDIQPWVYLPWTLGGVWFAWVIYKQTDWKLWSYRWQMRKLGYGYGRSGFTALQSGSLEEFRRVRRGIDDLWYPDNSWSAPMPYEADNWELGYGLPTPTAAHVVASIENWGLPHNGNTNGVPT